MHLVVGGSGQLGTALVRQLRSAGKPVRAFVRPMSRYQHLIGDGVELAFGDLRDDAKVRAAVTGVDIVHATASVAAPGPGDTYKSVEHAGYQSLIDSAGRAGAQRFVFCSVPVSPKDDQVPLSRAKRQVERALMASDVRTRSCGARHSWRSGWRYPAARFRCVEKRTQRSNGRTPSCVASGG